MLQIETLGRLLLKLDKQMLQDRCQNRCKQRVGRKRRYANGCLGGRRAKLCVFQVQSFDMKVWRNLSPRFVCE